MVYKPLPRLIGFPLCLLYSQAMVGPRLSLKWMNLDVVRKYLKLQSSTCHNFFVGREEPSHIYLQCWFIFRFSLGRVFCVRRFDVLGYRKALMFVFVACRQWFAVFFVSFLSSARLMPRNLEKCPTATRKVCSDVGALWTLASRPLIITLSPDIRILSSGYVLSFLIYWSTEAIAVSHDLCQTVGSRSTPNNAWKRRKKTSYRAGTCRRAWRYNNRQLKVLWGVYSWKKNTTSLY